MRRFDCDAAHHGPAPPLTLLSHYYPLQNYVTPDGQVNLSGAWTTRWPHYIDAISAFQSSASRALDEATRFDHTLREDARRVSGDNYAAIVELSTRQAFATFELTTGVDDDWKEDKEAVMAHLKEISSNGDMTVRCVIFRRRPSAHGCPAPDSLLPSFSQTIDVVFPLHPILLYTNPTLLAYLLEPLLRYTHSGLYPNRWPVHDLGTYPNSTGYNRGDDEPMPVEESGNMLWCALSSPWASDPCETRARLTRLVSTLSRRMALAYFQLTGDKAWVEKHYDVFKQWTTFLTDDGLVPAEQLSTDDFAGAPVLSLAGSVPLESLSELAHLAQWIERASL